MVIEVVTSLHHLRKESLLQRDYWFFSQQVMEWVEGFLASMDGKDGVLT
jgi:hypothetical protein